MELVINRNGVELLTVALPDNARESYNIGSHERKVTMSFERSVFQRLKRGDTITIGGVTYWYDDEKSTVSRNQQTNGFVYNVSFYGREWYWRDILLKSNGKTEIPLHTTAYYHLRLIADCLEASGFGIFNVSTSLSDTHYYVYKDVSVFDALDSLAGAYGAEWWVNGSTIYLGKNEYGTAVLLRDDQEVENISESSSSEKPVTRLYAYGGTKNMLNGERLKMIPPYVDLLPNMNTVDIIEGVHYFDEVYPRQQNTITNIRTKEIAGDGVNTMDTVIYEFRDSNGIVLSTADLLPMPLKVYFETGAMSGREFELIIIEEELETYYQIKYITENDNYVPRPNFAPAVGDKFILEGFNAASVMPALIDAARSELTTKAHTFIDKIGISKVYDVDARSIICEERGVLLNVGQSVTLQSTTLGSITTRVRGFDRSLYNPYDCKYEIGDSDKYSRLREIEARQKYETDIQYLRDTLMGYFADGVVDAVELSSIGAILASIQRERDRYFGQYNVIISNEYLADKTQIQAAWDAYDSAYSSVAAAIQTSVADGIVTAAEMAQIDTAMGEYSLSLVEYARQEQLANKSITDLISSTLTQWASDGVISPSEKLAIKQTRQRIAIEKQTVTEGANKYSISLTAYNSAWASYDAVLEKYSAATPENIPLDTDFAIAEEAYKVEKIAIDNAITNAQKDEIDTKQPSGNYLTWGELDEMFTVNRDLGGNIVSIAVNHPFFGVQEISAYGIGDGSSGGGGGVNLLQSWADYNATTMGSSWAVSAQLVKGIKDDIATLSLANHTHTWEQITGKPSTFAPSAHTHAVADVTGLSGALTNKLDVSVFNTHASNGTTNVKHLTDAQLTYLNNLISWWKVDGSGNLYTEKNLYSTAEVSSYGLGTGGSTGGGDVLQDWSNYDLTTQGWAISAQLVKDIKDDVATLALADHDHYVADIIDFPTTWGWGNLTGIPTAIVGTQESFTTTLKTKLDSLANYTHPSSHPINFIDGLQTALDGKATSTHTHSGVYEPVLGNPALDGYLLSSTTAGVRSWVKPYALPTASASTLGGVKIGERLSISNGVLSANVQSDNNFTTTLKNKLDGIEENANNYTLPTASASVLGGVKIGTNVAITNGVISVHNPLTIGTGNGLSLSTQVLSLALATTTQNGALSASDKVYINLLRTFFEYDSTNDAVKVLKALYSTDELSSYGLGSGSSTGGGDVLQDWANYNLTTEGWAISSKLVKDIKDDVANLALADHTHSWTQVTDKPATFTPSSHSHPTTDITGLGNIATINKNNSTANYLRGDGSWVTPPNTTYGVATTSANGLMSAADKTKLDGVATGANNYSHPAYTSRVAGLYKVTVDASGHVSAVAAVAKADITGLGIPAQDTTYAAATTTVAGLMSAADKVKLDGIATGAKTGTVTSVAMTVPTGLSISGSPITTSGTLALSLTSGYSIPTTAKQTNWDTAYGWGNHSGLYLPLLGGTVSGNTTFSSMLRTNGVLSLSGLSFWNVVNYQSTGTPSIIRINTRIPYSSSSTMPTVHLSGYAYGQAAPIELKISWYIYGGNYTSLGATCNGAWKPTIYMTNEGGYCSINLVGSIYYPRFTVDFFDNWSGSDRTSWATGWTVDAPATLGTVNRASVPYKDAYLSADTSGNAATATTLATARTINGTSFNGSVDITTANWGTSRNITIGNTAKSVNGSANVSWSLTEIGAASSTSFSTHTGNTSNPHSVTKAQVGLGNVDNTSDLNKPVSTATQTALNLKLDKSIFDDLFEKVLVSTGVYAIKAKYSFYSIGEVSSNGLGSGGATGGGDVLQDWASYNVSTEGWAISAKLVKGIKDDVSNLALANHTHTKAEITDFPTTWAWGSLTGVPSTFAPSTHSHSWSEITSKPTTFAPSSHTLGSHSDVTITSIAAGEILKWDGTKWINNTLAEAGISTGYSSISWADVTDKPTTFTPSTHSHSWSTITSKPTTFAPAAHTLDSHSNVTITSNAAGEILKWNGTAWVNNTLAEAGISASSHSHSWADITSKPTTFTPSTHTHDWLNITGKPTTYTPSLHSHEISDVTGLQTALNAKFNASNIVVATTLPSTPNANTFYFIEE